MRELLGLAGMASQSTKMKAGWDAFCRGLPHLEVCASTVQEPRGASFARDTRTGACAQPSHLRSVGTRKAWAIVLLELCGATCRALAT